MNFYELSKAVSHALRHAPWVYELELDEHGWTPVEALLLALRSMKTEWADLQSSDLQAMIDASVKKRHEIDNDRIRALYGHSVPDKLVMARADPPDTLYHGTSPRAVKVIQQEGLKPMGRQYVHLSTDTDTAKEVGKRKDRKPIILTINAKKAHEQGMRFYQGNEKVWLADQVPAIFICGTKAEEKESE